MKFQTVLLLVVLLTVAAFLIRRARNSGAPDNHKRFDSTLPQQDSSYLYVPVITTHAADGSVHSGQSTDCGAGSTDAGSGCSDGGGSSN